MSDLFIAGMNRLWRSRSIPSPRSVVPIRLTLVYTSAAGFFARRRGTYRHSAVMTSRSAIRAA